MLIHPCMHPCIFSTFPQRGGEGGKYLHFWGLGEEYWYLLLHFLLFLRVFGLFLRYSCSISFRELKNAIKISFFLYLGGLGTKIRFSSRKKNGAEYWYRRSGLGKDIGSTCLLYWGGVIRQSSLIMKLVNAADSQ